MSRKIQFLILSISLTYFTSYAQSGGKTVAELFTSVDVSKQVKQLSEECWRYRELDSDTALILGEKALELAITHKLDKYLPKLYGYIGVIQLHYLYKIKEAIPYLHSSMEHSLKQKDTIQLAYAYNNLGDLYLFTGNRPLSLKYSEQSLSLFDKLNYQPGMSYSYVNMGLVYRDSKKYDLALEYFQKAISLWKEMGNELGVGSVFMETAKTYESKGDSKMAMHYYQKSFGRSVGRANVRYAASCLHGMANIYYKQLEYEKALEYYQLGLKRNKERNHEFGLIDDYIGIGLVYAKQNKREEGEKSLHKALQLANRQGLNTKVLKVYHSLSLFYQILDDYEKATDVYSQFIVQYDSILSIQQFEIINEMQKSFAIQQALVDTEKELESQKMQELYLVIILVLLFVLAMVIYWRYQSHRRLSRKLTEMNQTKDKLFSVISHDLKNPFNSLIGFSELLGDELNNKNYEKVRTYSEYLHQASIDGMKLLTNLLDWSISQTGRFKFNPSAVQVEELFGDLNEFFDQESSKQKITLEFIVQINEPIIADSHILRTVLMNLISNAIKFTDNSGLIRVEVSQNLQQNIFEVKDNGVGMSAEQIKKIFDFSELVESKPGLRNERGTGLGLSICSELVKIHNGTIEVESEIGKGSCFRIKLPK